MTRDCIAHNLFIVWGFPESTQNFIHRELEELSRDGHEIRILAGYRLRRADISPQLASIADRAIYLGHAAHWVPRALAWAARHPVQMASAAAWVNGLPHRSQLHRARMLAMLLAAASVCDEVKKRGFRHLHAHFAAYQTELAMCLSRLSGVPYRMTCHAYGIWKDRNLLAEKIRGAEVVLTCTEYNARHLRQIAGDHADKVHLVYHGLDLDALGPPVPMCDDLVIRFLAVGRLIVKKGFRHLVEAAGLLASSGHDFELTILGEGPLRDALAAQTRLLGIADRVHLPGAVSNRDVFAYMRRSRALIAPSVRDENGNIDGIPNVILEAMASARPVVGTDLSGIPEVVKTGQTGYLVAPGDSRALATAMAELITDPTAAATMGRQARKLIEEHFDVKQNVARQAEILAQPLH
ncbi:MAG: glycosyltransferase family 4 protein [Proteobacteria bacterium]|nr:glycosyltransferase family 4 protein [Pseudomonadota bacterium]